MLKLHPESLRPTETLQDFVVDAGEEDQPPPEPSGGIPKQYCPGWIRWPLRVMLFPLIILDLYAQRLARLMIRTPFKQIGKCKKRGNCCYYILIPAPKNIFGKIYYLWNTEILGFYRRNNQVYIADGKPVYVMGCRYLNKQGRCSHYTLRPTVCRTWPRIEYFGYPRILKGCGYQAIPRNEMYLKDFEKK